MKKILITTCSVGLLSAPIIYGALNNEQNVSKIKASNVNDQDSYYKLTGGVGKNRVYVLELSLFETNSLLKDCLDASMQINKGDHLYKFLTMNRSGLYEWGWKYGNNFKNDQIVNSGLGYDDRKSIQQLFNEKNSHTWKGGFIMNDFMKTINNDVKNKNGITIKIWVQYNFFAHNLYGATYI